MLNERVLKFERNEDNHVFSIIFSRHEFRLSQFSGLDEIIDIFRPQIQILRQFLCIYSSPEVHMSASSSTYQKRALW